MKHTQGNWKVRSSNGMFGTLEVETDSFNYSGRTICKLNTDNEQAKANAEIICKAVNLFPELVEALKEVSDMLIHNAGDKEGNEVKTEILKTCPNVRDTMNKVNQLLWYKIAPSDK